MNGVKRRARQLAPAVLSVIMLVVPVAVAQPASAASNVTITIRFEGNACYVWGQKLSKWKAVITSNTPGGSVTEITVNNGLRSGTVSVIGGKSYNVRIQSWCNGIFLGRTAGGNRWAYSSGYQPNWTFYAGVWTG